MTVIVARRARPEFVDCEVRFPGTNEVVAHLATGGMGGPLERALSDNGFSLAPTRPRPVVVERTPAAA